MPTFTMVPVSVTDPDSNVASGAATDIDNTIAGADDGALLTSIDDEWVGGATITCSMSNTPGDFGSVNTVQFRSRAQFVNDGAGDQATYTYSVQGTNAPADTAVWDETDDGSALENRGAGSPVASSASQSDIDGWTVTLVQSGYVKDKGFDGMRQITSEIEIIVDYDAAAPPFLPYYLNDPFDRLRRM